jgi:hypothetical protein
MASDTIQELEEIYDIDKETISIDEHIERFQNEWLKFVNREITANYEKYFNLWLGMGIANRSFILKMEQLANKHFRGILSDESLTQFQVFVRLFQVAIRSFKASAKTCDLESILEFVKIFCEESFEEIDVWNSALFDNDICKLQPYRPEDLIEEPEPEIDTSDNYGFPSWIKISHSSNYKCSCEDDCDCDSDSDSEEKNDTSDSNENMKETEAEVESDKDNNEI